MDKEMLLAMATAADAYAASLREAAEQAGGDDDDVTPPAGGKNKKPAAKTAKNKKAKTYTMDEVKEQLTAVIKKHGREKAIELLQRHGVGKLSEVDEADYTELYDEAVAALEAEDDDDI